MKAADLDKNVNCPICNGSGEEPGETESYGHCPRCSGTGTINRYRDGPDDKVILNETFEDRGNHVVHAVETMTIEDPETGGFNGLYGSYLPPDRPANLPPDIDDQLSNNSLGTNGPYEFDGSVIDVAAFPGNTWPTDGDLSVDQIIAWRRSREDEHTATLFERLKREQNL